MKLLKTLGLATILATSSHVAMAAPQTYTIDPTHTATIFSWSHFGFSTPSANFSDINGKIVVDFDNPSESYVNVSIPVSSINTNVKKLDDELQTAQWFDAAQYPNITFTSTKVMTKNKKDLTIYGVLTIKGTSKPVVLQAKLNGKGEHPMTKLPTIGFNATTSFKRSDFGIGAFVPNVGDTITVNITTEASVK